MSALNADRIVVVSGLGNAQGTGAACARLFSNQLGYKLALISRPRAEVDNLASEINSAGGTVSLTAWLEAVARSRAACEHAESAGFGGRRAGKAGQVWRDEVDVCSYHSLSRAGQSFQPRNLRSQKSRARLRCDRQGKPLLHCRPRESSSVTYSPPPPPPPPPTGKAWPTAHLSCAIWNTGQWSHIPFLDVNQSDIALSVQVNIVAATAFAQLAIRRFLRPRPGTNSQPFIKGTLIMTGATSAWRGKEGFAAFAAGKHGLRALSQSAAREFGPRGVHVAFVVSGTESAARRARRWNGKKLTKSGPDAR